MGGKISKGTTCHSQLSKTIKKTKTAVTMVPTSEACRFMRQCLQKAGADVVAAEQQARLLLQSDIYGHPSHGMNRLELYVNDILKGVCKPNNKPIILNESVSTAWVDGNNVLGATASHFAMDVAMKKAKESGVGWVAVKGSNHNGIASYWAQIAANAGYIGMAFTNTSPLVAPTRSKQAALGTNPICMVAPASNGDLFLLDMSTAAVALGKIEMQRHKGEPIPPGWAQGADGKETRDTNEAYKVKRLYPLGGLEETSGYKGYGLGAMVEVLCGVCSGSRYGHHIAQWTMAGDSGAPADLGHCFIVVNPNCFAPGFGDRLADCLQHWRTLNRIDPNLPVLAPGDKERMAACKAEETGKVPYVRSQIEVCNALAKRLKIKPMELCLPQQQCKPCT